jgi:hypothetical protein
MIDQARKHVSTNGSRDEGEQSIHLKQNISDKKLRFHVLRIRRKAYHNRASGLGWSHESIEGGECEPHHDASDN